MLALALEEGGRCVQLQSIKASYFEDSGLNFGWTRPAPLLCPFASLCTYPPRMMPRHACLSLGLSLSLASGPSTI